MAVAVDAFDEVAQHVESRIGDPDVPVKCDVCAVFVRVLPVSLRRPPSTVLGDSGASEAGSGMRSVRAARLGPSLPTINLEQSFRRF